MVDGEVRAGSIRRTRYPEVYLNPAPKDTRAVLLDVDGTLMDTNYLHVEAWVRAFREVGEHPVMVEIHRGIGKGSERLISQFVGEDDGRVEEINRLHGEFYDELQKKSYPLPGAKRLISTLHASGYEVWLATSAKPEELDYVLDALDAGERISGIVSSDEAEDSKPAPDIFEIALDRTGVPADESLAVGDSVWDVKSSGGAGIRSVAVMTGGAFSRDELLNAGASGVYRDCTELLESGLFDTGGA